MAASCSKRKRSRMELLASIKRPTRRGRSVSLRNATTEEGGLWSSSTRMSSFFRSLMKCPCLSVTVKMTFTSSTRLRKVAIPSGSSSAAFAVSTAFLGTTGEEKLGSGAGFGAEAGALAGALGGAGVSCAAAKVNRVPTKSTTRESGLISACIIDPIHPASTWLRKSSRPGGNGRENPSIAPVVGCLSSMAAACRKFLPSASLPPRLSFSSRGAP